MMGAGLLGMLFSLLGILASPFLARWGADQLDGMTRGAIQQLEMTAVSVRFAAQSLSNGAEALHEGRQIILSINHNLETTRPLLESISVLLAEEAPSTIEATREALISAQAGAQAIDRVLRGLDALSPITGVTYQPEKPLEVSLADAAQGLQPLPMAFRSVDAKLQDVDGSLTEMQPVLAGILGELDALQDSMTRLGKNLQLQADDLDTLAERLSDIAPRVLGFTRVGAVVLGFVFFWLFLGQVSIYFVGVWLSRSTGAFQAEMFHSQAHNTEEE
jgi:hypothetical protein